MTLPSDNAQAPAGAPRLHVLVVEDNPDAAASLAMILEMHGHEVRIAHDGRSALAEVERFLPDVVFLDIGLPRTDGYEVARQMRALPRLKDVVLVAVTGFGEDEDKRRALDAGCNVHLLKPVEPQVLTALLERAGSSKSLSGPSAQSTEPT